jgi:DNA helicase-2/ATP-dependent DNA helicase PcrA
LQIQAVLETGYEAYLAARFPDAANRLEDLRQLSHFALRYDSTEAFLSELALLGEVGGEEVTGGQDDLDEGRVVLSSIHQAKGLEWGAVFLIWAADGKLPSARSEGDPDAVEEERRLFYVSVTRAKDELYLTYPQLARDYQGLVAIQRPSRFVQDLPAGAYEVWDVGEEVTPAPALSAGTAEVGAGEGRGPERAE